MAPEAGSAGDPDAKPSAGSGDGAGPLDVVLLESLVALIPDAAVGVDESGCIRVANRLAADLFGYALDELVDTELDALIPERFRAAHHKQQARFDKAPTVRPMGSGLELWGRRQDGTEFPVDISLAPVVTDDGLTVIATIRDVTQRRREQAAEAHLAAIVESTNDAIAATTPDGLVTSWNPGAGRLLGYTAEEVIGRPIFVVVAEEFREPLAVARERVLAGERVEPFEARRRHKDGSLVDVEVTLSAIHDRDGHLLGVSGVFRDITERRRAEAELARAQREHEELRMLADRERIARDLHDLVIQRVFAAAMTLQAATKLSDRAVVDERIQHVIGELDTVTTEIRSTIFALEQRRHGSTSLRRRVLDLVAGTVPTLGHEPVVRFDGPIDSAVPDAVGDQLLVALREALSNVVRHAHATATSVAVTADEHVALVVSDNGVGMGEAIPTSGLRNLRDRAEALGGHLAVSRASRGGTRLEWRVPITGR